MVLPLVKNFHGDHWGLKHACINRETSAITLIKPTKNRTPWEFWIENFLKQRRTTVLLQTNILLKLRIFRLRAWWHISNLQLQWYIKSNSDANESRSNFWICLTNNIPMQIKVSNTVNFTLPKNNSIETLLDLKKPVGMKKNVFVNRDESNLSDHSGFFRVSKKSDATNKILML